jgi:hypothetical protein
MTDTAIDFKSTQAFKDAQIILTDKIPEITGKVAAGGHRSGARLHGRDFFRTMRRSGWGRRDTSASARPDQQGLFKIRGLPAGARYTRAAVDYLEER